MCDCTLCREEDEVLAEVRLHNQINDYQRGFYAGYEKALYDVEYKGLDTPKRNAHN